MPAPAPGPRMLRSSLLVLIALCFTVLCALVSGASASALVSPWLPGLPAWIAAALAAFLLALVAPLFVAARTLRALGARKPHRPSVTLGCIVGWNLLLPGLLLGLAPGWAGPALSEHGQWFLFGGESPALASGIEAATGLLPGATPVAEPAELPAETEPDPLEAEDLATVEPQPEGPMSPKRIFAARADAVVVIRTQHREVSIDPHDGSETEFYLEGMGSGFLVSSDGLVVTNYHVIQGADRAELRLLDGRSFGRSWVLAEDPANDLALLQVPGSNLSHAPVADPESGAVGERAVAIGSPLGLEHTLTDGIVSAIRDIQGTSCLQIQTTIAPGSSGGPVFGEDGMVLGVATATRSPGLGLAVRARYVHDLLAAPREPRRLDDYVPGVQGASLEIEGFEATPVERMQFDRVLQVLGATCDACIEDLPEAASLDFAIEGVPSLPWMSQAELSSQLGEEVEDCIRAETHREIFWATMMLGRSGQDVTDSELGLAIRARLERLAPRPGDRRSPSERTLDITLRWVEPGEPEAGGLDAALEVLLGPLEGTEEPEAEPASPEAPAPSPD
jgi:serine protease Do